MSTLPVITILKSVMGFRSWKIGLDNGQPVLRSLYVPVVWTPRKEMTAQCTPPTQWLRVVCACGEEPPGENGKCGLWALDNLKNALFPPMGRAFLAGRVAGEVELWGNMIEGSEDMKIGYRAQYAYPVSLLGAVCGVCMRACRVTETRLVKRTKKERSIARRGGFEESAVTIVCDRHDNYPLHPSHFVRGRGWHEELAELYGLASAA